MISNDCKEPKKKGVSSDLVVTAAHALQGLAVGDLLGVRSLIILVFLLLSGALFGSAGTFSAFAFLGFDEALVFREESFGSIVSRDEPAVQEFVEIPVQKNRRASSNKSVHFTPWQITQETRLSNV